MCAKSKGFFVHLELPFDSSSSMINGLYSHSKVSLLRTRIEEDIGILPETYHLTYLDAAPLEDSRSLRSYDVINGATLKLCPWGNWSDLLRAAYIGNTVGCFSCSMGIAITEDSEWVRNQKNDADIRNAFLKCACSTPRATNRKASSENQRFFPKKWKASSEECWVHTHIGF